MIIGEAVGTKKVSTLKGLDTGAIKAAQCNLSLFTGLLEKKSLIR
jgi:hypothetical protein